MFAICVGEEAGIYRFSDVRARLTIDPVRRPPTSHTCMSLACYRGLKEKLRKCVCQPHRPILPLGRSPSICSITNAGSF